MVAAIPKGFQCRSATSARGPSATRNWTRISPIRHRSSTARCVVPNQIRTVLEAFRDSLSPNCSPAAREVPKTLIFAKDDSHAEDIVRIVREEFGKGNDFARRSPTAPTGAKPEELIAEFRNGYNPRIAVTVDMIATGTDVKPLEMPALHARRQVASLFRADEGPRRPHDHADALRQVTPDAGDKNRFVLVDAVGVTESLKHVSQPLDRERKIGFDRLIDEIAAGRRDDDAVSTLAARLAALDRKIDDKARADIADAAGGLDPKALAHKLLDAIDPDTIEREAGARQVTPGSRRRGFEGRSVPALRQPRLTSAIERYQTPDRDPHRHYLDRSGDFLRL